MREEFFKMLNILAQRAKVNLNQYDFQLFDKRMSDDWGKACEAIGKFFEANYGKPRLPSPDELKELIYGDSDEIKAIAKSKVNLFFSLIPKTTDYSKIRECVGEQYLESINRVCLYEDCRKKDESEIKWLKHEMVSEILTHNKQKERQKQKELSYKHEMKKLGDCLPQLEG